MTQGVSGVNRYDERSTARRLSTALAAEPSRRVLAAVVACVFALAVPQARAQDDSGLPAVEAELARDLAAGTAFRNLGPFRQGSWITAIAAPRVDPLGPHRAHRHTYYVGARNGGVWKTTNRGTTFTNVTDDATSAAFPHHRGIAAVGALAVSPADPQVVWVGTGDAENARSSNSGTGVWLSRDAGVSWQHVGLADAHHVARIVPHPEDPDTAWVASMGHLFSENAERGVFLTRDGGATWEHVLDLGPRVGVIDLIVDERDPSRLWAAAYDKQRLPWHFEAGGPGSGVYRSADGGATWSRLHGGFPSGKIGRIGIDRFRDTAPPMHRPTALPTAADILYAVVENLNERPPTEEERAADRDAGRAPVPRPIGNEVYRSGDGGTTWQRVSPEGLAVGSKSAYAFNEIRVDPWDPARIYVLSETLIHSDDGGRSYSDVRWPMRERFAKIFGDVRSMWIDPDDPEHILLGSDGGIFPTADRGRTSGHLLNLPLAEVYAVTADRSDPYRVVAGLQDHEAWMAPVNSWSGAVGIEDWVMVGRWDGMVSQISPDGRWYYATTQFGNHLRADLHAGTRVDIEPEPPDGADPYRFTWTTPLQISPHDPQVIWTGSQKLLRSSDRGASWVERSPDLTDNDPVKIAGEGHIRYCTITTLAESAARRDLLWVGTDDGRVWRTDEGGVTWTERTNQLTAAGAPRDRWVSRVAPSRHDPRRAYVAKNGFRRDDFTPYLYRTDDDGATWRPITGRGDAALPPAPIWDVVEDPQVDGLLFVATEVGVWTSLDGGDSWWPLGDPDAPLQPPSDSRPSDSQSGEGGKGDGGADREQAASISPLITARLPNVQVRDLEIQDAAADLVIGTYGRGVWIADIGVLRQAAQVEIERGLHLFEIAPRPLDFTERDSWGAHELYGDAVVSVPNDSDGVEIAVWLGSAAGLLGDVARLSVWRPEHTDAAGATVPASLLGTLDLPARAGLQRVRFPFPAPAESSTEDAPEIQPGEIEVRLLVQDINISRRTALLETPKQPVR